MAATDPSLDPTSTLRAEPVRPPADLRTLTHDQLSATADRLAGRLSLNDLPRWFWGEGVALEGLLAHAAALGREVPPLVDDYLQQFRTPVGVAHVNNLLPGAAAIRAGRRDLVAPLLGWPAEAPRHASGALEHWPGSVWADTSFMVGKFLIAAGQVAEAERQWLAHSALLQHPGHGLVAHGTWSGETLWSFWVRASAWHALAGIALVEAGVKRPEVVDRLVDLLDAVCRVQLPGGLWEVLVDGHPETRGIVETSGSAGLAAALLGATRLGLGDAYATAGLRTVAALEPYIAADGTLELVSAGTVLQLVPFGYSVIRADTMQLWGQGLGLLAYAEALRITL